MPGQPGREPENQLEATGSFAPLLLVIFLAFLVPVVLSRLRRLQLPIVVGEILAGIVIGRSGLALVTHDPALDLLSEFGFVFLMFLSGTEIDFSGFTRAPGDDPAGSSGDFWTPLRLAVAIFALSLTFSVLVGLALTQAGMANNPWMMALILSTTSLGVVLPVLKERGLSGSRLGQTLLLAALVADFATMLLITVLVTALSSGLTLEILLVGVLFVAFFFLYRTGLFFFNRIPGIRTMIENLSHATAQIKMRATFTVLLAFVVLSEVLGAEVILGAFLAGAIVSLLSTRQDVELFHQFEAVGFGFFIPIFFIMVGVDFNVRALLGSSEALLLLPILVAAAFAVKLIPALLLRVQYAWRETLAGGMLLSSRLSLIIAASSIGLSMGLISEQVNADVILAAIVTVTVSPVLFNRLYPPRAEKAPPPLLVVGANAFGLQVAGELQKHHERVVVVDGDPASVAAARHHGFEAVTGDFVAQDPAILALLDGVHTVVCTHEDLDQKYSVCHAARTLYGVERVITVLADPASRDRFAGLGAITVSLDLDWAAVLALMARNPATYDLLTRTGDDKEVHEYVVRNPAVVGQQLSQMAWPGDVRILTLRRNGDLLVPSGQTRLEHGDHLSLVGTQEHLITAQDLLAPPIWHPRRAPLGPSRREP